MHIEKSSTVEVDSYLEYLHEAYDLQVIDQINFKVSFPEEDLKKFEWHIGVILGDSGSGKTSILTSLGGLPSVEFHPHKALISNFSHLSPEEASHMLTSVGLSSVPSWVKPYPVLSNGEKYRAALALAASTHTEDTLLIDEYTSVVDRGSAKSMSLSFQKYIRRNNRKVILATCHEDIIEWLRPDWVYIPQKGGALERGDCLRQLQPIQLQVARTEPSTWDIFKSHHYLTEERNRGFGHLVFLWNGNPVGIVIYKNQPSGTIKNSYALSRTVVLPKFQGMGFGTKISEFTSAILKSIGARVFTKTVNPALGIHRNSSSDWRPTSKNGKYRKDIKGYNTKYKSLLKRGTIYKASQVTFWFYRSYVHDLPI